MVGSVNRDRPQGNHPKLRAVLTAQRGDYGPLPAKSSFGMHAVIMRHYLNGAYYPKGGAKAFADALVPSIEKGGGRVRVRAHVTEVLVGKGAAVGVRLKNGAELRAAHVFSDARQSQSQRGFISNGGNSRVWNV